MLGSTENEEPGVLIASGSWIGVRIQKMLGNQLQTVNLVLKVSVFNVKNFWSQSSIVFFRYFTFFTNGSTSGENQSL